MAWLANNKPLCSLLQTPVLEQWSWLDRLCNPALVVAMKIAMIVHLVEAKASLLAYFLDWPIVSARHDWSRPPQESQQPGPQQARPKKKANPRGGPPDDR
jgi:hypothetical protein